MKKDNINPDHYKRGDIEVIDFILDQNFNYLEGNIIKYVSRYKDKNGLEDLKKAQWYLNRLTQTLDKRNVSDYQFENGEKFHGN
tara:strand:- start:90 stop:341 length:252 start_codon:yes stop_codon:yes gene_type:complete